MREPLNTDSCGVPGSGEVEYPQRGYGQPYGMMQKAIVTEIEPWI